jgi:phage-related protein
MGVQNLIQSDALPNFRFWDKSGPISTLVLTTHGIVKKTGKTPQADLDKAERIRNTYFSQKTK